jgi:hypothetical protein
MVIANINIITLLNFQLEAIVMDEYISQRFSISTNHAILIIGDFYEKGFHALYFGRD